jgi:hypothetical protein
MGAGTAQLSSKEIKGVVDRSPQSNKSLERTCSPALLLMLSNGIFIKAMNSTGVLFVCFKKLNEGVWGGCDVLSTMRSSASF